MREQGIIDHEVLFVTCKNYMNDFIMKCTCDILVLIVHVGLFFYFFLALLLLQVSSQLPFVSSSFLFSLFSLFLYPLSAPFLNPLHSLSPHCP